MSASPYGIESPNLRGRVGDEALLVIEAYSRGTGIRYPGVIPPPQVATQAAEFVKAGYAIHGLELTIAWVKKQIAEKKSGYRETSLRWHNLFGGPGEGLQRYAELHHFAQKAWDNGWRPRLSLEHASPSVARLQEAKAAPAAPAEPELSPEEKERIRAERLAQLDEMRASLRGGRR